MEECIATDDLESAAKGINVPSSSSPDVGTELSRTRMVRPVIEIRPPVHAFGAVSRVCVFLTGYRVDPAPGL